ncbi:MAG: bifunctional 4-hydroxy-2-oxoglutarate aldolase/2-dehydro-3-deoxy-phosphogluconate aldolase [Dehalococcoidia bacterium]|jgi:2-dehydro-3-deoxyphosphogluconate aldolase/(4S)-4-hydroxy-2-oxoglutarate aldolase
MSEKENSLKVIEDSGIIAVIRSQNADEAVKIARAISEGGIVPIEITLTVPDAFRVMAEVRRSLGERILLGAGTVLDAEGARLAIRAGAEFLVSPMLNPDMVRLCKKNGKVAIPGAFTPTEIVAAWKGGADIIKIFPASLGGPELIKDLRGPFPQIKFLPTGGVMLENVAQFIKAGAVAVAVGGNIIDKKAVALGKFDVITENSRKFLDAVKNARIA